MTIHASIQQYPIHIFHELYKSSSISHILPNSSLFTTADDSTTYFLLFAILALLFILLPRAIHCPAIDQNNMTAALRHPRMLSLVSRTESIIGYIFSDKDICWEALQVSGSGVMTSGRRFFQKGNQRLAVLGDAVLSSVLAKKWFEAGTPKG